MDFNSANKKAEYIWINGKIIPWDHAYIHVLTHSLHYSGSVFEGQRAYNGAIFKLKEHSQRLIESARLMGISSPFNLDKIIAANNEILTANNFQNAYIRPLIWRGECGLGLFKDDMPVNMLITMQESNHPYKNNLRISLSKWRKNAEDAIPAQSKSSAHYAMAIVAKQEAKNKGFDDALMLDQHGFIAECSTSNIFFAKENELITPIADRFLNGITRQTIIEIAKRLGMNVNEKRVSLDEIKHYNSCFVTGTAIEIAGATSIQINDKEIKYPDNKIAHKLQEEFTKLTGKITES